MGVPQLERDLLERESFLEQVQRSLATCFIHQSGKRRLLRRQPSRERTLAHAQRASDPTYTRGWSRETESEQSTHVFAEPSWVSGQRRHQRFGGHCHGPMQMGISAR